MSKPGVWALTASYNDYNQHGDILCCLWPDKPTIEQLAEFFNYTQNNVSGNVMAALSFVMHLLSGGGRRDNEDQWYNLTFHAFGERISE